MKTVSSLSGGKTSSYLAVHYPADYELFSLVCIDDPKCSPKDKTIVKRVNDKLQKYCSHQPEFIATPEDDKILKVMFDLEQKLGREIIWLRGESFDEVIRRKKALPNMSWRFCTTEMKLKVIFEFWLMYISEKVKMRVGFRKDEEERRDRFTTTYKYPWSCNNWGKKRQKWKEVEWREGDFPLIENNIFNSHVTDFWKKNNLIFAEDSNCLGCFWKAVPQLNMNWRNHPEKLNWFNEMEIKTGKQFKKQISLQEIFKQPIQQDFFYGTGSGCQAGFCTD